MAQRSIPHWSDEETEAPRRGRKGRQCGFSWSPTGWHGMGSPWIEITLPLPPETCKTLISEGPLASEHCAQPLQRPL